MQVVAAGTISYPLTRIEQKEEWDTPGRTITGFRNNADLSTAMSCKNSSASRRVRGNQPYAIAQQQGISLSPSGIRDRLPQCV